MSNRSKTANAAAAGKRGRRPSFDAWALVILMMTWAATPGAVRADAIVLQSGELIDGSIVGATRNTVIVRRAIGGMRQMRIRDIEEVRVDLVSGGALSGQILSWVDGVYRLRSGDEVIRIRAGRILSRAPHEEADRHPSPTLPPRQKEPAVEMKAAPAAAAAAVTAERSAAPSAAAKNPAAERTAATNTAPRKAASRAQTVAVKASVHPAETGVAGLVFRIELSRPAEQTVVLIYGTVDGTAKAGRDYEAKQGIVTFAPGAKNANVYVPLTDHQLRTGGSRFELFLTADPEVAEIVNQRITATVPGDDDGPEEHVSTPLTE